MQQYYITHTFVPGQTIDAIIKLKGRHNYTRDEMLILRGIFKELNGPIIVKAGTTCKIPTELALLNAVDQ